MLFTPSLFFFFFSISRRHTRLTCDWSQTCALPIWRGRVLVHRGMDAAPASVAGRAVARPRFPAAAATAARQRALGPVPLARTATVVEAAARSEERRVGKECRSRWWAWREKKEEWRE